MTHRNGAAPDADVLGRWRMLAEQRLEYLTQLFESGRWRRFYDEVAFLENIREAKVAVETWRGLSAERAAAAERVIRVTWTEPAPELRADPVEPTRAIAPEPIELPVSIEHLAAEKVRAEAAIDLLALEQALGSAEQVLDLSAIEHRYPILRNAL